MLKYKVVTASMVLALTLSMVDIARGIPLEGGKPVVKEGVNQERGKEESVEEGEKQESVEEGEKQEGNSQEEVTEEVEKEENKVEEKQEDVKEEENKVEEEQEGIKEEGTNIEETQEGVNEEGEKQEGATEEVEGIEGNNNEDVRQEGEVVVIDKSDMEVEGDYYINITRKVEPHESQYKAIIPEFKIGLYTEGGTKLGEAVCNETNYNKDSLTYAVHFTNMPKYKKTDKFVLKLESGDGVVKGIELIYGNGDNPVTKEIITKGGEGICYKVGQSSYSPDIDTDVYKVRGSDKATPLNVSLVTNVDKIGVKVIDEQGNPVTGREFEIERTFDGSKFKMYTDIKGVMWLDRTKVEPVIKVRSLDKNYEFSGYDGREEIIFPIYSTQTPIYDFLSTEIVLKEAPPEDNHNHNHNHTTNGTNEAKVKVSVEVKGDTRVTDKWVEGKVILTPAVGDGNIYECKITKDGEIDISNVADGEYKVTVESNQAKIKVKTEKIKVKDGKGTIKIEVSPKYKLEVLREVDGKRKAYNFSFTNVKGLEDKKFKGSVSEEFGVVSGASYVIKDNENGKTHVVDIEKGKELTKLILGDGVIETVKGEVETPHTSDSTLALLGVLGLSSIVAGGVGYKLYENNKKEEEEKEE